MSRTTPSICHWQEARVAVRDNREACEALQRGDLPHLTSHLTHVEITELRDIMVAVVTFGRESVKRRREVSNAEADAFLKARSYARTLTQLLIRDKGVDVRTRISLEAWLKEDELAGNPVRFDYV